MRQGQLGIAQGQGRREEGRHARLVGTRLLSGLRPDGEGGWKGRAYLPKRNMHATAIVHAAGGRTMVVKGCLVGGMICKEQRWTRVN